MIQALYNATSGLTKGMQSLDVVASNLSNVNKTGYKTVRADFADLMTRRLTRPLEDGNGPEYNLDVPVGARLARTTRLMTQGSHLHTGRALDFAVSGDGFFTVQTPDGDRYTRDGAFYLSVQPDGSADLVDAAGHAVLGTDGQPINLTGDLSQLKGGPQGELIVDGEAQATLGLVVFENPGSLETSAEGLLVPGEDTGAMTPYAAEVRQYYLEQSNVDMATEMTRMIRAQRGLQLAARVVTMSDQMMGLANTIR